MNHCWVFLIGLQNNSTIPSCTNESTVCYARVESSRSSPKLEKLVLDKVGIDSILKDFVVEDWMVAALNNGSAVILAEKFVLEEVGEEGLHKLASMCGTLSSIVIRRRVGVGLISLISAAAPKLAALDLRRCFWITDQALEAIGSSISRILKQLVLACCGEITDAGVLHLQNMCVFEELTLAHCRLVTDVGAVAAISAIRTLKKLNLTGVYRITNHTLVAQNCLNLEVITLESAMQVTGVGIRAFSGHKCLQYLNLLLAPSGRELHGSDLELVALGCPSMKRILVLSEWRREDGLNEMQKSTLTRFMRFLNFDRYAEFALFAEKLW